MKKPAIEIVDLSKSYKVSGTSVTSLGDAITRRFRKHEPEANTIWPLDNINLEINQGETIGVLGRNGAGKSTLLKIISRITKPTKGHCTTYGRVGSLLEVGTGFSRELTGRENVYLNGTILGMSKKEISEHFDEIVEFANVARFIDTPIKHYSSGMQMRLAFSVAAHLAADILIVDEVLAVGDTEFQNRCIKKMGEIENSGRTIVLVSHNMTVIERLCSRSILLEKGKVTYDGRTSETIDVYLGKTGSSSTIERPNDQQPFCLSTAKVDGINNDNTVNAGTVFKLTIEGYLNKPSKQFMLSAYLLTDTGQHVFDEFLPEEQCRKAQTSGKYKFDFLVPEILAPGRYRLGYWAQLIDQSWDVWEDDIAVFEVTSSGRAADGRILDLRPNWQVEKIRI